MHREGDDERDSDGRDLRVTHSGAVTRLGTVPPTVAEAIVSVVRDPAGRLIRRWNWKSALTSSLFRAALFFFVNLAAGPKAAAGALLTELVLRSLTSGFYGSLTEALREAEPGWLAGLTAALLMPVANHSLELLMHWLRGTPKLANSILASVCFTAVSTLFTLYVMRHGVLIVGENRQSLSHDLRRMPCLVGGFLAAGPLAILRWCKSRRTRGIVPGRVVRGIPIRPDPGWENEDG
jgi:hypothetical protein